MRRARAGMAPARGQRGVVAVMFAILIVTLCTTFAVALTWDNTLTVRRTTSMLWREQAMTVALGAENWVGSILEQDFRDDEQADHLGEIWAQEVPPLPVEGAGLAGEIYGSLEDLQGRFNVNNLLDAAGGVNEEALEQYRRLLIALELDPRLAGVTADFLDPDVNAAFPDGAEDDVYTGFVPPYRPANQPLSSVSELAALAEMEGEAFERLRPHVAALPASTAVNVNTATPLVLQSLDENLSPADVERLLEERAEAGFADVQASFASLVAPEVLNTLGESSSYFRLTTVVRIGTVRVTMYSLLHRGAQGSVTTILRSFSTD